MLLTNEEWFTFDVVVFCIILIKHSVRNIRYISTCVAFASYVDIIVLDAECFLPSLLAILRTQFEWHIYLKVLEELNEIARHVELVGSIGLADRESCAHRLLDPQHISQVDEAVGTSSATLSANYACVWHLPIVVNRRIVLSPSPTNKASLLKKAF